MKSDKTKVLNMQIPEDLYNKLKEDAQNKGISLAGLVRMILLEYDSKNK